MSELTKREQQAIIDPRTGVMFSIEEVKDDLLVEIFTELEAREKQMQEWRRAAEDELARRYRQKALGGHRTPWTLGSKAVTVESNASRVWDATELQLVVEDLIERGLLSEAAVDGLVLEQEPKVDGKKALDLLNRSQGDALMEISRCFHWKRGRARVRVTPTAQLER